MVSELPRIPRIHRIIIFGNCPQITFVGIVELVKQGAILLGLEGRSVEDRNDQIQAGSRLFPMNGVFE